MDQTWFDKRSALLAAVDQADTVIKTCIAMQVEVSDETKDNRINVHAELYNHYKTCNHHYANGAWAGNDGFMYGICKICGRLDP